MKRASQSRVCSVNSADGILNSFREVRDLPRGGYELFLSLNVIFRFMRLKSSNLGTKSVNILITTGAADH